MPPAIQTPAKPQGTDMRPLCDYICMAGHITPKAPYFISVTPKGLMLSTEQGPYSIELEKLKTEAHFCAQIKRKELTLAKGEGMVFLSLHPLDGDIPQADAATVYTQQGNLAILVQLREFKSVSEGYRILGMTN